MSNRLVLGLFVFWSLTLSCTLMGQHISPDGNKYIQKEIHGFKVMISDSIVNEKFTEDFLDLLSNNLYEINQIIPSDYLKTMQSQRIWLEQKDDKGVATYHPSINWLKENNWNTDFARCMHIGNIKLAHSYITSNQPYVVLHELTHLAHDHIFGYDNADIAEAYSIAKESGKYDSVQYYNSPNDIIIRRAYALNNDNEYFAELTEAYFGKNDFYPFTYNDLKLFDPVGFALMEKLWGIRKDKTYKK